MHALFTVDDNKVRMYGYEKNKQHFASKMQMSRLKQRIKLEPLNRWLIEKIIFQLDTDECNSFNNFISSNYPWQGYVTEKRTGDLTLLIIDIEGIS